MRSQMLLSALYQTVHNRVSIIQRLHLGAACHDPVQSVKLQALANCLFSTNVTRTWNKLIKGYSSVSGSEALASLPVVDIFDMGDSSTARQTVLVTGFGPFGTHTVNASWVAVQELEYMGISPDVELVTKEISVTYETVQKEVPRIWEDAKPQSLTAGNVSFKPLQDFQEAPRKLKADPLVVHVGVSGIARDLTLEQQAHNDGYDKHDVNGVCPQTNCCVEGGPLCLQSKLDMTRIMDHVNRSSCNVRAVVSQDPGRYLCDFIYFTSLNIDNTCTAFIHVPPLHKPYSARQLAEGIREAILAMLEQIS